MYVNTKNKVLGLHDNTDTNEQRQAVGRRGQKQKEKCGTVEGRLSPAPASTKRNGRSPGKRAGSNGEQKYGQGENTGRSGYEIGSYRKE